MSASDEKLKAIKTLLRRYAYEGNLTSVTVLKLINLIVDI